MVHNTLPTVMSNSDGWTLLLKLVDTAYKNSFSVAKKISEQKEYKSFGKHTVWMLELASSTITAPFLCAAQQSYNGIIT